MNLSVFVVEDENLTRKGIRENVPWDLLELNYVGEANNGEEAYPQIIDIKPDILITDIKMPLMNGLELSAKVREVRPNTKIIIISAHDEFALAQKAIDIGVHQYVLKPITPRKIISALQKVQNVIQNEIVERQETRRSGMESPVSFQTLERVFESIEDRWVMALLVDKQNVDRFIESSEKYIENKSIRFFQGETTGCLITAGDEATCRDRAYQFAESYDPNQLTPDAYFAMSRVEEVRLGPDKIYNQAHRVLDHHHLFVSSKISSYDDLELLLSNNRRIVNRDSGEIVQFLLEGSVENVREFLELKLQTTKSINLDMKYFLVYVVMDVLNTVTTFLTENIGEPFELIPLLTDPDSILNSSMTIDSTISALSPVLIKAIELRNKIRSPYYNVIQKAKQNIEENFNNPQYSLIQCAEACGMSPAYFSTVFKQTVSESFVKYLTSLRMDRARILLRSTTLQAAEISREVGYRDPHYFSFAFRKFTGMAPTEYRNNSDDSPEIIR